MVFANSGVMVRKGVCMKIVYLHHYFLTPKQGGAIRSYHLAKALVEAGHEVEMITAHNHATYRFETIEGINVHYLPVFYENNLSPFGRILSFAKFTYKAYRKAATLEGVDLCFATSTPLTVGLIAILLKKFKKIPYFFEVRDLWPEAPIQLGVIKNRLLIFVLYQLETKIYQEATKIISLSPTMTLKIAEKISSKKIYTLPNFSDCDYFYNQEKNTELKRKYNVEGKFVVTYIGALGMANHLDYLLDAALALQTEGISNITFIIAGKGGQHAHLQQLISEKAIKNSLLIGHLSKYEIRDLLQVTDAIYISFANFPILETNSPNKFFDGLAAGKICITNTKGWIKELIEEHQCGFYYDPKEPNHFIPKILSYSEDTTLSKKTKLNAIKLAENTFSKKEITRKFVELFK